MIDWVSVGFAALWIFGLAVIVAALSLADYEADRAHLRFRDMFARSRFQAALNIGMMLTCLGLIGNAREVWERFVWGGLAAAFGVQTWLAYRTSRA